MHQASKDNANRKRFNRRSIRLQSYDYSQTGHYFVTICTQNRRLLFGDVADGQIRLNDAGKIVDKWWRQIPKRFTNAQLDEYQIMPNHLHGIIQIVGVDPRVDPNDPRVDPSNVNGRTHGSGNGRTHGSAPTVGSFIQWFKTMVTNAYIRGIKNHHWPRFRKRLWQRNYYESIIRTEEDLHRIRHYIRSQTKHWGEDENNPAKWSE